jgi:hypothetical protein
MTVRHRPTPASARTPAAQHSHAQGLAERQNRVTKLALIAVFVSTFLGIVAGTPASRRHRRRLNLPASDFVLLIGSTFRLGRLVAFDKIFDPVRAPWTVTTRDETGAGQTVEARGEGVRRAIGELISCPICAGTWISAGLVYALHLFPGPARLFMTIMSTIGIVEMLNALTEHLSWMGRFARTEVGLVSEPEGTAAP